MNAPPSIPDTIRQARHVPTLVKRHAHTLLLAGLIKKAGTPGEDLAQEAARLLRLDDPVEQSMQIGLCRNEAHLRGIEIPGDAASLATLEELPA
jgi:hypothetical protein